MDRLGEAVRPWLLMPASWAHHLAPVALNVYGRLKPFQTLTWSPFTWRDLEFSNRLGIAGGVDKDAHQVKSWWTLGPGFLEIGTVTPLPQPGNPGKRVGRDVRNLAVWNRLGFPSRGAEHVANQLKNLYQPRFTPLFANIGKNKNTPLDQAHNDYITCMRKLRGMVDGFVINLSSPNTPGLRDLLKPDYLKSFLEPILEDNRQYTRGSWATPVLLKISPDLTEDGLAEVLDTTLELGIDGWVLTNTTQGAREGLAFPTEGGVSGKPLAPTSKRLLAQTIAHLGARRQDRLVISVGGVLTPEDVFERLEMGADLVQVYAALLFNGPFFFRHVAEQASLKVRS